MTGRVAGSGATSYTFARSFQDRAVTRQPDEPLVRLPRTLYYNDARHQYLFVTEPPMSLEDAQRPVDEVAGTAVDTFTYAVARRDGLFYPSKVGMRFGGDILPLGDATWWRAWHNMQSLIDQGLDPLRVLIDRARDNNLSFIVCLRVGAFGEMDASLNVRSHGSGFVLAPVRDHALAVARELAQDYPVDGIELDFTDPSGPAASTLLGYFVAEDLPAFRPVMTEWVRSVAKVVRDRNGGPGVVGARIYPTEQVNLGAGLDIQTWLQEGLVDYVAPTVRGTQLLHQSMDIDWLIEAAHERDVSVYPLLHPMYRDNTHATPEMMRAAFGNYRSRGVDGHYTWALKWPPDEARQQILTEQGDADSVRKGAKHYFTPGRVEKEGGVASYQSALPLSIAPNDTGVRYGVPMFISDDLEQQQRASRLRLFVRGLVDADEFTVYLNDQSVMAESSRRYFHDALHPETGRWVEFALERIRPQTGDNLLEIELHRRGANDVSNPNAAHGTGLVQPFIVEEVELIIESDLIHSAEYPSQA